MPSNPSCFSENASSFTAEIKNLRRATKYSVTVAAGTSAGYGPKSTEISKITNEGKHVENFYFLEQPQNDWLLFSPNHHLFDQFTIHVTLPCTFLNSK